MSSGILLCRGNSLSRLSELRCLDIKDCFIVNDWKHELFRSDVIDFLRDKKIIHYLNREPMSVLPIELYTDFNIEYCQLNVLPEEYETSATRKYLNHHNVETKSMSDKMIPYSTDGGVGFPSMGVVGLVHMSVCLDLDDIYIIGMDFFEDDYYTHHSYYGTKEVHDYQKEKNKAMAPFVENFIKTQPKNKRFTFYTNSSFNPNLENVRVIRSEKYDS